MWLVWLPIIIMGQKFQSPLYQGLFINAKNYGNDGKKYYRSS